MKRFSGTKSIDDIRQQCGEQDLPLDETDYILGGHTVTVGTKGLGHVVFNTFNGMFSGVTPEGLEFCSSDDCYDDHPWFNALLDFFYVEHK